MGTAHGAVTLVVAGLLVTGLPAPPDLTAQEFHVDRDATRSVVFVSRTTLDTFRGTTDAVDGYVLLDGDGVRPLEGPVGTLYFEVDLATLDTGIGLRNRHMRENYLEVDSYPFASFEGRIDWIRPDSVPGFRVAASGTFSAHGVERPRELSCTARSDGDGFLVNCGFPVLLQDHDIDIPRLMFMRLAEEVQLELDFRLRRVGAPLPHIPEEEAP